MRRPKTYFGYLDTLVGSNSAIDAERLRLDQVVAQIGAGIRKKLTPGTVPGLLWHLALREIERIQPVVGVPLSNFAGQWVLSAACAAIPFTSVEPADDPKTDELLQECEDLWHALFFRETIDDLKFEAVDSLERRQRMIAGQVSLLSAVQGELTYAEQIEERIVRVFGPFSDEIIEPAIGISTDDVIAGFRLARELISKRLEESHFRMTPIHDLWQEYRQLAFNGASGKALDDFVIGHPKCKESFVSFGAGIDRINKLLLFRPSDFEPTLNGRGKAFLDAFSFVPGTVNLDLTSPYDSDSIRLRPFAKLDDQQFVLMDVLWSSFAPLYRLIECFDNDRRLKRLNKNRDKTLEDEAAKMFASVVTSPDLIVRGYYVAAGAKGELAERDLLILKEKCLFVIESKARPLRSVKFRRDKIVRIATDVKQSIQEGYDQACDVVRLLKSSAVRIPLFDSNKPDRKQIAELEPDQIEHVIPIVFLDAYYGLIATDLEPWISLDPSIGYPWVVDRDTFASIILKIDTFAELRSFILWRRQLHGTATNEDEAVFAGFYLRHGPLKMPEGADMVQFQPEYSDIFDAEYFRRKGIPVDLPAEESGPPVFTSGKRVGDDLVLSINGNEYERIDLKTGVTRRSSLHEQTMHRKSEKVGRNDPCPCGSGQKYKRCCLRKDKD